MKKIIRALLFTSGIFALLFIIYILANFGGNIGVLIVFLMLFGIMFISFLL
jgi:hypothetical protein